VDRSASFDILVVGGGSAGCVGDWFGAHDALEDLERDGRIGWMRIVCSGQRSPA
jgi:hypothetical protein